MHSLLPAEPCHPFACLVRRCTTHHLLSWTVACNPVIRMYTTCSPNPSCHSMRKLDMTIYSCVYALMCMWVPTALPPHTRIIDNVKRLIDTGQYISESCEAKRAVGEGGGSRPGSGGCGPAGHQAGKPGQASCSTHPFSALLFIKTAILLS